MAQLAVALLAVFLLQMILSGIQMKHFSNEFLKLRRQGKVACGRKSGGFFAGAIVLFLIDDAGVIQTARKLEGVTCFARVKPLSGFEGKHIGCLTETDLPKGHKNLGKAIIDASLTYRTYMAGERIEYPPTPLVRFGHSMRNLCKKSQNHVQ